MPIKIVHHHQNIFMLHVHIQEKYKTNKIRTRQVLKSASLVIYIDRCRWFSYEACEIANYVLKSILLTA